MNETSQTETGTRRRGLVKRTVLGAAALAVALKGAKRVAIRLGWDWIISTVSTHTDRERRDAEECDFTAPAPSEFDGYVDSFAS